MHRYEKLDESLWQLINNQAIRQSLLQIFHTLIRHICASKIERSEILHDSKFFQTSIRHLCKNKTKVSEIFSFLQLLETSIRHRYTKFE